MPGGYVVPSTGPFGEIERVLDEHARDISENGRASGTQTANLVQRLFDIVNGITAATDISVTGTVTAGGNITSTSGRGYFGGTLWSVGSSATDLSTLPGLRQTAWQIYTAGNTGLYGYSPSSFRSKTHWRKPDYTAAQFLACFPYAYEYRGQVSIRDDKLNPNYDPNYVVPLEIGYIAELLIKNGLEAFVTMKNGVPIGIDYASFAAVGMTVVGRELWNRVDGLFARIEAQDAQMDALEARLKAAGF